MADLKNDLLNKLGTDKMYAELELVRLSEDPNMNYRNKISQIDTILGEIAMINAKLAGVQQYYTPPQVIEPVPQNAGMTQSPPPIAQMQAHNGQSHGE